MIPLHGPAAIHIILKKRNLNINSDENINIINLGCRLNIYEGEVIKSLTLKDKVSDLIIINSCSVTQEAEKKVEYEIRKSKKKFPS